MAVTYSTYEAKAKFSEVIRKVRAGQRVVIAYRGEEIAERLALGDGENLGDVVEAPDQAAADLDRGGAIGDPALAGGRLRKSHPQRFVNEPLQRFLGPGPLPS